MAITNRDRVNKAMDLLRDGLAPYVDREFKNAYKERASQEVRRFVSDDRLNLTKPIAQWDVAALLRLMWEAWNDVFRKTLGQAERSLVSELRTARNNWAHQQTFSSDDADRALDSTERLLTSVSAEQADEVRKIKVELRRVVLDEQSRSDRKRSAGTAVEGQVSGNLKAWREVATPHIDVASGNYQQAEFAADLWQVHLGQGTAEYRDPSEFFRRTYLTDSLKGLLVGAVRRIAGSGGDPVVQLQTNFGGGKTHAMLALYHLFSGVSPTQLPGVDAVLAEANTTSIPKLKPVVLVGNKISPGNPSTKKDGTVVRTLWGELAWQLGGRKAFDRIKADDERATNPGDVLRELFLAHGPSLILIDEWVAYARQLHDSADLPAGTFETQFSFAQALTESAKLAGNCLLVISLPASDTTGSPHTQADDVEVGGVRGREALDRLRNVIGRVESSWRPATAEEGFEIVRRRLFEPLTDPKHFVDRDNTARAFYEMYRTQKQEFPPECADADYEKRLRAAYPIHPEIFDRLYGDWGTLVKFQRTRGVLRLMAAVIHSLWEKGDRNPLILPSLIPIDDARVQSELTRYLSDHWAPIIAKDVDGPGSLPMRIDSETKHLGQFSATRRVARTIYLGSAPSTGAANLGLEDRRVRLGCVMPGEQVAVFGDALRRLAGAATHLYQDGTRYWYATKPNVTKLAEDRTDQFKREPDKIADNLEKRLRKDLLNTGDFARVHPLPASSQEVADDLDARLVVLAPKHCFNKDGNSGAEVAAKEIFQSRGNAPRLFRNTLVFLAADQSRLQELEDATAKFLAWDSILRDKNELDLTPHQVRQAETQKDSADKSVDARIPETYQWLLIPTQEKAQSPIVWQATRLTGTEPLSIRTSRKLKSEELLITSFGSTRLRMAMDDVPLWRGDHVSVQQLVQDFAQYLYLPRLQEPTVLVKAIQDGFGLLTWEQDSYAYAESYDEAAGRYRGVRAGEHVSITTDDRGLLVKPAVARAQLEAERPPEGPKPIAGPDGGPKPGPGGLGEAPIPGAQKQPTRYHASASVDPTRAGRDAGRIAEEVIVHLASLIGAQMNVTIEIDATIPNGVPENVVRTVTENGRTLRFTSQGFETE